MLATIIVPGAVLFFLLVWIVAEESTFRRTMQRIRDVALATPAPVVEVTPAVTKPRRRWF